MNDVRKTKAQLVRELMTLRAKLKRIEKHNDHEKHFFQPLVADGSTDIEHPSSIRGISDRHLADDVLSLPAHTLRSIGECVSVTDLDNKIVFVNDAFLKTYGYTRDELRGKHIRILRSTTSEPAVDQVLHATLQGGWQGELINRKKDGTQFPITLSTSVVRNEKGEPTALVGIAADITKRTQVNDALRASEERYRRLFEGDLAGDYVSTPEGKLTACNAAFARIFRFKSIDDALATNTHELYPNAEARQLFLQSIRQNRRLEFLESWLKRRDGTDMHVIENTFGVFDDKGELIEIQGYLFDDTERKRAEEALRESEERYRDLVENSLDLICTHDMEGNLLSANSAATKLSGFTEEELVGKNLQEFLAPEGRRLFKYYLSRIQATGSASGLLPVVTKSGEKRTWEYSNTLRTAGLPAPIVRGLAHDITERKRAEKVVEEERNLLRSVINAIPDEIVVKDLERKFMIANEGCLRALGKQRMDQVVGLRDEDLVPERFVSETREKEIRVLTSGEALVNDLPELKRDEATGELVRAFLSTKTPLRDRDGRLLGLVVVNRDTTQLHRVMEALGQSETRFRTVWDNSLDAMRLTDVEGNIVMVNRSYCQLFKRKSEELVGHSLADTYVPKPGESIVEDYRRSFRDRTIAPFLEAEVAIWSGEQLFLEISNALLSIPGQSDLLLTVFRDITGRKRAALALAESEERYRLLFENSGEAILFIHPDGTIYSANPEACRMFGRSEDEIKRIGTQGIVESNDPALLGALEQRRKSGRFKGELLFLKKDGTVFPGHISSTVFRDSRGEEKTSMIIRDISMLKSAEAALRESERRFRETLENVLLVAVNLDTQGNIVFCNDFLLSVTGWQREQVMGKNWFEVFVASDAPIKEVFADSMQRGTIPQHHENEIITRAGDRRLISWNNTIIRDPEGRVTGTASIGEDITERKRSEERLVATQEQLHSLAGHLQSVREEERKHLAQEFHDQLGQTLTAIKMDLSMLHRAFSDASKVLSRSSIALGIESAQDMIDRAIAIIREILSELRPELLDQLGIVPTLEWEAERFQRHSGISCAFRSTVEAINLDANKSIALYRIFQESVTNVARHAKATKVEVALWKEAGTLVLEIKDNGVGIAADARQKPDSFGLIGMRERVILLGGTLEIEGIEGKGTTILVRIPYEQTLTDGSVAL